MSTITSLPTTRLLLTEAQFCAWLGQATAGERIEYHRGFLAVDAARDSSMLPEPERKELVRLGRRAFWAFEHELVHLAQRRLGPDRFSYLAFVRARPKIEHAALIRLFPKRPGVGALTDPGISIHRLSA